MKRQRAKSCNYYCRRAFTLVEVVASLMLLGTLLVGILAAHRRHTEQVRSARARLEAVAAAEKLLESWCEKDTWGATSSSGRFAETSRLSWRWTITARPELRPVNAAIGRLEVLDGNSHNQIPLVSVEILTNSVAATSQVQQR